MSGSRGPLATRGWGRGDERWELWAQMTKGQVWLSQHGGAGPQSFVGRSAVSMGLPGVVEAEEEEWGWGC